MVSDAIWTLPTPDKVPEKIVPELSVAVRVAPEATDADRCPVKIFAIKRLPAETDKFPVKVGLAEEPQKVPVPHGSRRPHPHRGSLILVLSSQSRTANPIHEPNAVPRARDLWNHRGHYSQSIIEPVKPLGAH